MRQRSNMIVEHNKLSNCCIRTHSFHLYSYFRNSVVKKLQSFIVKSIFSYCQSSCFFIYNISPQALQESHTTNNITSIPWSRFSKRSHTHFIQAERICSIILIHVIWGNNILQALTHFAKFTINMLSMPSESWFTIRIWSTFFNFSCWHILTTIICVSISLNHTLIK